MSADPDTSGSKADDDNPLKKRGIRGYFGRRLMPFGIIAGRRTFSEARNTLKEGFRPSRISLEDAKTGFQGRHGDGGRARFREEVERAGMDEAAIDGLSLTLRQQSRIMLGLGGLLVVLGVVFMLVSQDWLIRFSGLTLALMSLICGSMALRYDFSAWQLRERRFGGLGEYLRGSG